MISALEQPSIYFHMEGQFFLATKKNGVQLEDTNEVKHLVLDISGNEVLSDDGSCKPELIDHDACIRSSRESADLACHLPFLYDNMTETCPNFAEGAVALRDYLEFQPNCINPCSQFEYRVSQVPIMYFQSRNTTNGYNYKDSIAAIPRNGYYIDVPEYMTIRTSVPSYSFVSFVAEFAGWAGLFLGLSFSGTLIQILPYVLSSKFVPFADKAVRLILYTAYILSTVCLSYLFVKLFMKLIENRSSTSIQITDTTYDFAMSVCALKAAKQMNASTNSFTSTMTGPFLKQWTNINSKLSFAEAVTSSGKINLMTAENQALIKGYNVPQTAASINFCHTIDISSLGEVQQISMELNTEVSFFFHYPGQFLSVFKDRRNMVPSLDKNNMQRKRYYPSNITLTGIKIMLEMESIDLGYDASKESYDDCIISQLLNANENLTSATQKLITSRANLNTTDKIELDQLEIAHRLMFQLRCDPPNRIIKIKSKVEKQVN